MKTEKQMAFAYKNGSWSAHHISKNETANSGETDVDHIASISHLLEGADVYIVHNHPGQTPEPSNPDYFQYGYIRSILALCRVDVTDYMIVSPYGYFSFKEAGLLRENQPFSFTDSKAENIRGPILFRRIDLIQEKENVLALAEQYGEIILNNRFQYGTEQAFDGTFLLKQERFLSGKNIFFKRISTKDDLVRLQHIDRLLDPIDIYLIKGEQLVSYKTTVCV